MGTPLPPAPTVVIYQNPVYVAGILQEMFDEGLLEFREIEQGNKATEGRAEKTGGHGKINAAVKISTVVDVGANIGGNRDRSHTTEAETGNTNRTRHVYSNAYYLHVIRRTLRERHQVKLITPSSGESDVVAGQFVEFNASFRSNEINTILDIATPDLVAAVTAYIHERKGQQIINSLTTHEAITAEWQKHQLEATSRAAVARAITHAVRTDFRSDSTREFYGCIPRDVGTLTAITICDSAHFVADDQDRILDGEFTVLGKVISDPEQDVAVLERNKVLRRIDAKFLESSLAKLQINTKAANAVNSTFQGQTIDTKFSAIVQGMSFRVLPIAVYA